MCQVVHSLARMLLAAGSRPVIYSSFRHKMAAVSFAPGQPWSRTNGRQEPTIAFRRGFQRHLCSGIQVFSEPACRSPLRNPPIPEGDTTGSAVPAPYQPGRIS